MTNEWYSSRDGVPDYVTQVSIVEQKTGKRIATVFDAAAIGPMVAARELLEACRKAIGPKRHTSSCHCVDCDAQDSLRKAVNKAEGI